MRNIAADVINEATATQIQDAIQKEIDDLNNTPTETPGARLKEMVTAGNCP